MVPGGGTVPAMQRIPLPGAEMLEEEPLYVNAKQYHRILKRRQARAKLEAEGKIPKERRVRTWNPTGETCHSGPFWNPCMVLDIPKCNFDCSGTTTQQQGRSDTLKNVLSHGLLQTNEHRENFYCILLEYLIIPERKLV